MQIATALRMADSRVFFAASFGLILSVAGGWSVGAIKEVLPPPPVDFPTTPATRFGAELVEVDLMQLQEVEMQRAERSVRARVPPLKEVDQAISVALQKLNSALVTELNRMPLPSKSTQFSTSISKSQAEALVQQMRSHPVVGDEAVKNYETGGTKAGFCFGRAAFVHLELLRQGVNPESIGKIFAVGGLMPLGGGVWDYHVSTVVRRSGGGWWAIDGLTPHPLELEEWIKSVLKMALFPSRPTLRFYFSDAVKFLPTPGVYSLDKMYVPLYRGFFIDLFSWFSRYPLQRNGTYLRKEFRENPERISH